MDVSVKRVKSKKALGNAIDDAIVEGWEIKTKGDNNAVLKKKGSFGGIPGHLLVFLFFGWWLLLIPNLLYAGYRYYSESKELQIKVE
jgi:hypothetical protein